MDIVSTDLDFIAKHATSNSAILFLGAGFSADAKNKLGKNIPVGSAFAQNLWTFLNYPGAYDGTMLPTMFQAALKKKHSELQQLLDDNFLCTSIPDWYQVVSQIFWARIYTTNVDNLIEKVYQSSAAPQKLAAINGITQDYEERDQFLETIQYIKLNGTLTDKPTSITFSTMQYADRLANTEPWYDQFVRDYSTRCTIFIGTKLDEPLFWQAIAARDRKYPGGEPRPKSFIISRSFSPAQIEALKDFNVIAVPGTAREFFDLLIKKVGPLPSLDEVVLKTNPGIETLLSFLGDRLSKTKINHIQLFYSCFHPVRVAPKGPEYRSYFLLGSEPQWNDIFNDFDAPREFNAEIVAGVQACLKIDEVALLAITGSAGAGKSTVLKRVALSLATMGNFVFFTHSEELPPLHVFETVLELLPKRSIIVFDNAGLAFGILGDYLAAAKRCSQKHLFIIAARTNRSIERLPVLGGIVTMQEYTLPDLSISDVDNIIDLLERKGFLGRLANTPRPQQREMFLGYAHNQILVAMRRATLGAGFDDIIKNEFLTLEPLEAKMMYLCASLVTDAQFTISKQQLIACISVPPAEALNLIQNNLRGVLIPTASNSERYAARHRVIAELILQKIAPRGMLKEAYITLLKTVSHDLPLGGRTNLAIFRLFRRLINHRGIFERFAHHLAEARSIYTTVAPYFSRDYHFWLQFGSLELEYGELANAANYIEQAHKYSPTDNIVLTTRAHLIYKQSLEVTLSEEARLMREEARKTLQEQMQIRAHDNYPFHIYCTQELAWIHRWISSRDELRKELEELRTFAKECVTTHPTSTRLKQVSTQVSSAYLDLAKPNTAGNQSFNPVID